MQPAQSLDRTFAALADPTRRSILARLALGEATVSELAEPFTISQPAISRHIRVLLDWGLIVQRVDGTKRPCRLAPGALSEIDQYLQMLRGALESNYRRLDQVLAKHAKKRKDEHS
ncbi:MAG: metalloregulator ArsR/SmtB family transcription factor [Myxococcota bacterium]